MAVIKWARYQAFAQNENGDVLGGATVLVTRERDGGVATLYEERDTTDLKNNSFQAEADGSFFFYVAGGAYRIDVTKDGYTRTYRHVAIGTAGEYDASDLLFAFPMFWQAANKPGLGEHLPPVDVPVPLVLYTDKVGWFARLRTPATSNQDIPIVYRAAASGSYTTVATLTFLAGAYEGTFAIADDVILAVGGQIWPIFPNPRDATMADFSMCIVARR